MRWERDERARWNSFGSPELQRCGCWETPLEIRSLKKPLPFQSLLPRRLVSCTLFFFFKNKKKTKTKEPFSSLNLGNLLCVSVLHLVRILGSTRGWLPCLSPPSFTVFPLLPFSDALFLFRLADLGGSRLVFTVQRICFSALFGTGNPVLRWPPGLSGDGFCSCPELGVLTNLRFRDPGHFKAGMLYESFPVWQRLLAGYSCAVDLLEILWDGVRVENFFTPFRGDFKGSSNMRRPLLPFRSRTLLIAHSSLILLAIPL